MAMTYERLMAMQRTGVEVAYTARDSMFYALSVGAGAQGSDERSLPLVYEGRPLKTLPTQGTVLMQVPVVESGIDLRGLLHGSQQLRMYRPLPVAGKLVVDSGVARVIDKGPEKGSVVFFESHARTADGEPVFKATSVMLARRDGGIGGPSGSTPPPHELPSREPDLSTSFQTRPDQALLYRLNDDLNPLHVDPEVAKRAGFPAPILHGLCTYGMACEALVRTVCGHDPDRIEAFDVRFSGVVFPGDRIELQAWVDGPVVSFRCHVPERDATVLDNGRCVLRG